MKKITIVGILVVSILGTLFHFLYDFIPIFLFPKNESIFEHTKLIFFPILFYAIGVLPFVKENQKDFFSSLIGANFMAILLMIVSYYTYSGFLGQNIDAVNIIIYYISIIIAFFLAYKKKIPLSFHNSIIYIIILTIIIVVFTYLPPALAFFMP